MTTIGFSKRLVFLLGVFCVCLAGNARAQYTWNGGSGNWNTAANWNDAGVNAVPPTSSNLIFDNAGGTISDNFTTNNATYGTITFNSTAGAFIISPNSSTEFRPTNIADNSLNTETINVVYDMSSSRTISEVSGANLVFGAGVVGSAVGLTINASGATLTLGGASNTYTGTTVINSGTVIVSGALSGAATLGNGAVLEMNGSTSSGITTETGGTLEGQGSIAGLTTDNFANETLAPGYSTTNSVVGTLTSTGNVTLPTSSASNFDIRLGVVSATDHDELSMSSATVALGDAANLNLTLGSAFLSSATVKTFYNIIVGGASATGTATDDFANAVPTAGIGTLVDGNYTFSVIYGSDGTTDGTADAGSDVTLELTAIAIPEPGTWAMLLGAVGMLGFCHRLRERRA